MARQSESLKMNFIHGNFSEGSPSFDSDRGGGDSSKSEEGDRHVSDG